MEMSEIIKRAEGNIRQALRDYGSHTRQTDVLDDVSEHFIRTLASDSSHAKQELRKLFSKSPVWDEKLDALVINGTRTHNPDYSRIHKLANEILSAPKYSSQGTVYDNIESAIRFFSDPGQSEADKAKSIAAINKLAPRAYAPTKKPSRVFKAVCVALGIADETAGSGFQRLYAQFADELSAKKISFRLYVSINPAHFLTMSNPKGDRRGPTLTSCHSFNSTEYSYNNGCSGYARDETSFIVFTVSDPTDPETFNNRKTTRQVFAYRPGSGLLLQSRMYNTSGGTCGAQEDSRLYRDLVQREISRLENVPNLWKTSPSYGGKEPYVETGEGFGGYTDWTYSEYDGHVSFRADCDMENATPLEVGTYGLCIGCGCEINEGLYCDGCKYDGKYACDDCGEYCNDTIRAYDRNGNEISVCQSCLDDRYIFCDNCEEYHHNDDVDYIDGRNFCNSCRDEHCEECCNCGEWHDGGDMFSACNSGGDEVYVCENCIDDYFCCDYCGEYHHRDEGNAVYTADGSNIYVCEDCLDGYAECPGCGEMIEVRGEGTCPKCGAVIEKEEEAV